ncbi:retron Ec78 anti-phage system effector ATPase PtuA [Marinobacterium stanieri]|uniref:Predicted ATP-binding protein involved in virulence n=1 Tax=Marinobacterium stanieri TaxID=49186 RepID=A0A1N6XXU2_9GAMM|nr:retron Ec78 anti-phage system effector ATPase PtuA [Marinobacterium stanieri]SIR07168.1 Predicted ATP-binding protein involved in virulence [Marinobacterium stanieri]
MSRKIRAFSHIERNSDKGDVLASYSLFERYKNGIDVEIDENLSKKYLLRCFEFVESIDENEKPNNLLLLSEVGFVDFRAFKNLELKIDRKLTVIIGDNAAGKTSILEGVSKILSWIAACIVKEGDNGKRVTYPDINNNSTFYGEVYANLKFGDKNNISASLSRAIKGSSEKKDSHVSELKSLADFWRKLNGIREINLPVFAFYSVERSHYSSPSNVSSSVGKSDRRISRFDAYQGALDGPGRFDHFIEWFVFLSKKTKNTKPLEKEKLKKQLDKLRALGDDNSNPLWDVLVEKELEYKKLESAEVGHDDVLYDRMFRAIRETISRAVPGVSDIWVDSESGYDIVYIKSRGENLLINQLSDGQRALISLVSDLARRVVMLNPKLNNPLHGQGIVLIDEIELHLHPRWQQGVISSLVKSFPNIQFIITTHSPQILSTVDKSCIRRLVYDDNKNDILVKEPDFQTKGVMSSDVLEQIMETSSIPDVEEARWLDEMLFLIAENNYETSEGDKLLEKIRLHFGENHPEFKRCETEIRIKKMKQSLGSKVRRD